MTSTTNAEEVFKYQTELAELDNEIDKLQEEKVRLDKEDKVHRKRGAKRRSPGRGQAGR